MAVEDDPRLFYYNLDCHVRELPYSALTRIGQRLIASLPGRDWRAIGDQLGYTMAQMENFEHQRIPGYELLRDWSMRTGTTIRVLQSRLRSIGRDDIVLELDDIRQNPITLVVVIHDSQPPFDTQQTHTAHTHEIRGRKELWDGLLSLLKEHVSTVTRHRKYTFFNLRELSWQTQCHDYQGQQLDIDVRHEDMRPPDSAPGVLGHATAYPTELEPSWHLMSPAQLRYSRDDCAVRTGNTSTDGDKVVSSSFSFKPEVGAACTGKHASQASKESGKGSNSKSEGHKYPKQESCGWNAPESLKPVKCVSFSCKQETNVVQSPVYFYGLSDLSAQQTMGLDLETVKISDPLETTKQSLDLRSCEDQPDPRELSRLGRRLMDLNIRSEERPPRMLETDMARKPETSTIFLKSDASLSENCGTGVRGQESYSSAVVAVAHSSSAAGPGEASGQELMELRGSDLFLENENLVSEGFVVKKETKGQQACSLARRHVYLRPKSELIRGQFPGLWDLPGFHPKLKHKISLINEVMKPYEKTDGWYLIRAFLSDENMLKVDLALTITHRGKLKHFLILQDWNSNPRRYFLFSNDYEATSISELIDHYKTYPLIPGSRLVHGTNLPKLINPIPSDSFNYM